MTLPTQISETLLNHAVELTKIWLAGRNGVATSNEVSKFLRDTHGTLADLLLLRNSPNFASQANRALSLELSELDLIPHASTAAAALMREFPSVVFTSGRRTVREQANAMAGNVLVNRNWIEQTYSNSAERAELQDWVNGHPKAIDRPSIAGGLESVMASWTDEQKIRLSRHFAGLAFDVSPASGVAVKEAIAKLPELVKFLDSEGGITIWHAEFKKA